MNLADKVTSTRLLLAPVFFGCYFGFPALGVDSRVRVVLLLLIFTTMELSDLFDGLAARKTGTSSNFGKLFDPFADVLARMTYFVCFAFSGMMPLWILLLVLYREYGILFLRLLMSVKGITMGARPGGKLKAVVYMVAGALTLLLIAFRAFGIFSSIVGAMEIFSLVVYCLAAVLSVFSFLDYWIQFRKLPAT